MGLAASVASICRSNRHGYTFESPDTWIFSTRAPVGDASTIVMSGFPGCGVVVCLLVCFSKTRQDYVIVVRRRITVKRLFCFGVVWRPSNMQGIHLSDGSVKTILCAATLRRKLQVKLTIAPSHNILTPNRPVLALTRRSKTPCRADTGVPVLTSLVWLDRGKQGSNSESLALEADTLPPGQWDGSIERDGYSSNVWHKNIKNCV